jgi:hypothetical protein
MRERIVELGLVTIAIVALSTELLSLGHWLAFPGIALTWALILGIWVWGLRKVRPSWNLDWINSGLLLATLGLWIVEGLTAIVSPPNSSDAMAYHMPRVIYWMQQRSVEFFATPYLNQIMLQPLHEYLILHFQMLTSGDRFANCVAWLATGGYIVAASLLAKALGANLRGQAMAAFLAATLPNGILQASGVKNEALLSFLLLSLAYFALESKKWHVAVACGLACLTKGTAFVFAGPLVLLLLPRALPHVALAVLLLNGAFFARNIDLSGSPLGFDSAHADGKYRWRNEYFGWQPTVSNLIRHLSEQLGARSENWNQSVFQVAQTLHTSLGLRSSDPATTWPYTEFVAPRSANHETDGNNRWHFALLLGCATVLAWRRDKRSGMLLLSLGIGIVVFCFYLKWQPFMLRMWLPHYALGMAICGALLGRAHWVLQVALCVFLLDGCRLPLLKNWVRPLRGPENMFTQSREDLYYSDMRPWKIRPQYDEVMKQLRESNCRQIAFDINAFQLEYPIQALLLQLHPETRFVHVNTQNPSRKYEGRMSTVKPCVLVCLACDRWIEPIKK